VRNPFIGSFDSFEALVEYADAVGDKELTGWAKVVDEYGAAFSLRCSCHPRVRVRLRRFGPCDGASVDGGDSAPLERP